MIGKQRRAILALFGAVAAACTVSLVVFSIKGCISDLAARTARYERRLSENSQDQSGGGTEDGLSSRKSSSDLEVLIAQIDRQCAHFYGAGELSLAEFSSQIQDRLTSAGLTIRRYRPVDHEGTQHGTTLVEFVVQGRAVSFLAFLAEVSRSPKYCPIPRMTIRRLARAGFVEATFRIGYEAIEMDGSQ